MSEHKCIMCNKEYSSYNSLWNHNYKYHKDVDKSKKFVCKYCGDRFSHKQSKYNHEKNTCKRRTTNDNLLLELDLEKIKELNINKELELEKNKETNNNKKIELEKIKESREQIKLKIIEKQNELKPDKICPEYIYLIEKYDINTNQPIYKVGKTKRPLIERWKEHCLTSDIILSNKVKNCDELELKILNELNKHEKVIKRSDIGIEYFSSEDPNIIKNIIFQQFIKSQ